MTAVEKDRKSMLAIDRGFQTLLKKLQVSRFDNSAHLNATLYIGQQTHAAAKLT